MRSSENIDLVPFIFINICLQIYYLFLQIKLNTIKNINKICNYSKNVINIKITQHVTISRYFRKLILFSVVKCHALYKNGYLYS
jgi:hypothetical protein